MATSWETLVVCSIQTKINKKAVLWHRNCMKLL